MHKIQDLKVEANFSEHKEFSATEGHLTVKCLQKNHDVLVRLELTSALKNNDGEQISANTTLDYTQAVSLLRALESAVFIIERGIDA